MNENEPGLNHCITAIAWRNPKFTAALMHRIIAMTKINIYPMSEDELSELVDRLGNANLPPLESIPWEELSYRMANKLKDPDLANKVREFEPFEAFLLLCASEIAARSGGHGFPTIGISTFFAEQD